ncbi:MAG: hypothetical protein WC841_05205 [Candidatus Shapirobacteria bacterium]|jgi:hypothetical protein
MAETGGEIVLAEPKEAPYAIPKEIPRNSLDFRIAQLEQVSRIRRESVEAMNVVDSIEDIRVSAIAHAQEAELSDWEIDGMKRVFDRWDKYDQNLSEAMGRAETAYFNLFPNVDKETSMDSVEYNKFVAKYLYRDLFEKEPQGNLGVFFHGRVGVCFIYDDGEDFPQFGNLREGKTETGGALLKGRLSPSLWEESRVSRYRVLVFPIAEVTSDFEKMIKHVNTDGKLAHEVDHDIRHILDEEFTEGYTDEKGVENLKKRYVDILNNSFRFDTTEGVEAYDQHALELTMMANQAYAAAKDELLAHMAGLADYLARRGEGGRIDPQKMTQSLMENYNFLGINPTHNHFQRATDELRSHLTRAMEVFDHVACDIYRSDYVLTAGILELFDITRWPAVSRAIENKTRRHGLPAFMQ